MSTINWGELPFSYKTTNVNIRCTYSNNSWGQIEVHTSETVNMHISATCLHYGQECFEGLKAYRGKDGKIRLFRWKDNAIRMNQSAVRIGMPAIPEEIFESCLQQLIQLNNEFIPPYGHGATFYIRPVLLGVSPKLGLSASEDYILLFFGSPVGPYFKNGFKPGKVVVERDTDRAAPLGTGNVKVGGNYAAALNTTLRAQNKGYSSAMYLDPKEKTYIDECGPANFFAIKGNTYVTPASESILNSITNLSLMQIAEDMGLGVERRKIALTELAEMDEAAQCGTAAVLSPIYSVYDEKNDTLYTFGKEEEAGPICTALYNTLTKIQLGEVEDPHNWITIIE